MTAFEIREPSQTCMVGAVRNTRLLHCGSDPCAGLDGCDNGSNRITGQARRTGRDVDTLRLQASLNSICLGRSITGAIGIGSEMIVKFASRNRRPN